MARFTGDELMDRAEKGDDGDGYLYQDLISDAWTVVFAEEGAGKTHLFGVYLAVCLMNGLPFLGRSLSGAPMPVTILATDAGADGEYLRRFYHGYEKENPGCVRGDGRLIVETITSISAEETSRALSDAGQRGGVVILDHLTGCIDGSITEDAPVRAAWQALKATGLPTVVLAHRTEKRQEGGRKPTTPLGSSAILIGARHSVRIEGTADRSLTLHVKGNNCQPRQLSVVADRWPHQGCAAGFSVVTDKDPAELAAEKASKTQQRKQQDTSRFAAMADAIVAECLGQRQKDVAGFIHARWPEAMGKDAKAVASNLSNGRDVAGFLEFRHEGSAKVLAGRREQEPQAA